MTEHETVPYAVDIAFNPMISDNPLSGLTGIIWSSNEGLATKKLVDTALIGTEYIAKSEYIKDMRNSTKTYSDYSHEIERIIEVDGISKTRGEDFKKYQEALLANEMIESDIKEDYKRENNFSYLEKAGLILDNFRNGKVGIIK